jgi:hypothetical protein
MVVKLEDGEAASKVFISLIRTPQLVNLSCRLAGGIYLICQIFHGAREVNKLVSN